MEQARSGDSMQLTLETDVDGFRYVEIVGMDLYLALGSAILSIESILLHLRQFGEVNLQRGQAFDPKTDTIFFCDRVKDLTESLL
jgi:hypothetical protein